MSNPESCPICGLNCEEDVNKAWPENGVISATAADLHQEARELLTAVRFAALGGKTVGQLHGKELFLAFELIGRIDSFLIKEVL